MLQLLKHVTILPVLDALAHSQQDWDQVNRVVAKTQCFNRAIRLFINSAMGFLQKMRIYCDNLMQENRGP
jgi:hypothetical protein